MLPSSFEKVAKLKGEFLIIPKGIEYMPVDEEEVHVMLIELKATLNIGDVKNERP